MTPRTQFGNVGSAGSRVGQVPGLGQSGARQANEERELRIWPATGTSMSVALDA